MPKPKQICPECATFALFCEKSSPTDFVGHLLEVPKVSLWICKKCGARFELTTPSSTMRRIRKGKPSPDLCQSVLDFLGISGNFPKFPHNDEKNPST